MDAHELVPGDVLEHTEMPDRVDPSARQRLIITDVLRLGLRLRRVGPGDRPFGTPLLLGFEHAEVLRRAS